MAQKQDKKWIAWVVIAVAALLAGVGVWWWLGMRANDSAADSQISQEVAPADTTPEQITKPEEHQSSGYLVLSQWNVRFKPSADVGVITYVVNGDTVAFSNEQIESIDPVCNGKDGKAPFGTLTRTTTAQQPNNARSGDFVKKIGEHYYEYTAPTSDCGDNADAHTLANKLLPSFKTSIDKLEATPKPADQQ